MFKENVYVKNTYNYDLFLCLEQLIEEKRFYEAELMIEH